MAPLARLSTPNNAHSMASLVQCLGQKKHTYNNHPISTHVLQHMCAKCEHCRFGKSAPMCFSMWVLYVHVSGLITWVHACFFTSLAIERYRMQCSQSVALLRPHKHPHDVLQFYNHWLLSLCPRAPGWML